MRARARASAGTGLTVSVRHRISQPGRVGRPACRRERIDAVTDRITPTDPDPASEKPVVLVVDDDQSLREALSRLLRSVGLRVETYNSAQAFLQAELPTAPCCVVLDVRMPGQSGLDLQAELAREEVRIPIIFMTGHGDVP